MNILKYRGEIIKTGSGLTVQSRL